MDIHEYLGVLRRGWALVVLGVLLGIVAAIGLASTQVPSYTATSRELLTSDTSGDLTQSLQASNFAQARIASYVLVASSGLVLQPVINELGLDLTVDELASQLTITAPAQTLGIDITATADDPQLAMDIANTTSRVFADVVATRVEAAVQADKTGSGVAVVPLPTATPKPTATPSATDTEDEEETAAVVPIHILNIEKASLPSAPQGSNSLLLAVGAFLGLALGLVGASVREALDRRIRGRRDVAAVTRAPIVAQIRADRAVRRAPLVVNSASDSAIAESFRTLRANLDHLRVRDDRHSFVISSMAKGQGTTTVTANLALALANTATTVVAVDANLSSPALSSVFGPQGARGLTDVLAGQATLEEVLRKAPAGNVWLLPIGTLRPKTSEQLATPTMRQLLVELRERFDVVLVDAPPVTSSTDATVLGSFGCATLLIVPVGVATRPALSDALAALALGGGVPAGIVLNRIPIGQRGRRAQPATAPRVKAAKAPKAAKAAKPVKAVRQAPAAPAAPVTPAAPQSRFAPTTVTAVPTELASAVTTTAVPVVRQTAPRPVAVPPAPVIRRPSTPVAAPAPAAVRPVRPLAAAPEPERVTVRGYSNVTSISPAVSREREARESYELRSRELERAAQERLAYEQELLERKVRAQLEADRLELGSALDDYLEETIILPKTIGEN